MGGLTFLRVGYDLNQYTELPRIVILLFAAYILQRVNSDRNIAIVHARLPSKPRHTIWFKATYDNKNTQF